MTISIKKLFLGYLHQLNVIADKVPEHLLSDSLYEDMFSLEINAQIAANFLLRGYCPLVSEELVSYELSESETGKESVRKLLENVRVHLEVLPEVIDFDDSRVLSDSAGFAEVVLPQSSFIFKYIVPNYMFHASMVYAIARKSGASLSKGDFDGLHTYPSEFSFLS